MKFPKSLDILKAVNFAFKNMAQWEKAAEHVVVARDPADLVEVVFRARTNRFEGAPKLLQTSCDAHRAAEATQAACNRAMELSEEHWVRTHKALSS